MPSALATTIDNRVGAGSVGGRMSMRVRVSMRVRAGTTAAVAALVAGVAAGCGPTPSPSSPSSSSTTLPTALADQKPQWRSCKAPPGGEAPGREWRCTDVQVPLDYAKPDGDRISIALIRKEATDKSRRIGSLLFNFGGPGASGVRMLPPGAEQYEKLNTRYDLVGFDPRGVEQSSGVVCRDDKAQEESLTRIDASPDTAAEEAAFLKDGADFGAGCARGAGKLLPHITTTNAARDMDLIRQVLGDDKLHYLGFSYGTQLGGAYAHLFPRHVGRAVLDAVIDPTADTVGHARHQTTGFQRALNNYFKSLGEKPEAGTASVAALLKRLDARPLPTSSGRKLTESLAVTGIAATLYAEDYWPHLTEALAEAEDGNGDTLLELADYYNDRDENGRYGTMSHSQRAISCADNSERPTVDDVRAILPEFTKISPVFGPFLAWDTVGWCSDWPVKGEAATTQVSAPGAPPILVVGTTGDSATPYEGAKIMADQLGKGVGVLLTNEGEGHGAYGSAPCVTETVNDYLLDGTVPANGKTCS